MSIVLNEREYAEYAIENHILDKKPVETLGRIAKYYVDIGYKRTEICHLLEDFMLKCDPSINIVKWQATIEKQVKDAYKYSLVEIDYVPITKKELEICSSLNGVRMQRLMFTLICLSKFANLINDQNNNWVNRQDKEIFKLANIVTSTKRQSLMLNDLRESGLIKFSRKVDNVNINVLCLDIDEDPVLHISDFRNLGYQYSKYRSESDSRNLGCQYSKYRGESYFECISCGLVIKKTQNRQKYCKECGVEINRQKSTENWYKYISN